MNPKDDSKYYVDQNYEDPLVKLWHRYKNAIGRLYNGMDPQFPEMAAIRIRSFILLALVGCYVGMAFLASAGDELTNRMPAMILAALTLTFINYFHERVKPFFRSSTSSKWFLRGWYATVTILCLLSTFVILEAYPSIFEPKFNPSLGVFAAFLWLLVTVVWAIYLEFRLQKPLAD